MPQTHDIGPAFIHRVKLEPGTAFLHRAPTNEIEEPYRRSNSVVVRLFRRFGVVLGWWKQDPDRTEDEALLAALRIGAHGGHDYEDSLALLDSAAEDGDSPEGQDSGGRVGDARDARPAVIHFR